MFYFFKKISRCVLLITFLLIIGFLIFPKIKVHAVNTVFTQSNQLCDITRDLKLGMVSNDVKELQKYLNTNGFPLAQTGVGSKGQETNYFGPLTKNALIKLQKDKKIFTTIGVFDLTTRDFFGCEKSVFKFTRDLKLGMVSNDVKELQKYLNTNGFPLVQTGVGSKGQETNYFGPLTKAALLKFQNAKLQKVLDSTELKAESGNLFVDTRNFINSDQPVTNQATVTPILSYILTYITGDGGTISGIINQTVNSGGNGTSVTAIPSCGYYFTDWSDGSTLNPRTDINVTSNKSITANFTRRYHCGGGRSSSPNITTYTITFDGNGSDGGSTATQILNYNTPTNLTANGYTRVGYTFDGWNTVLDGSGTDYADQALYTIGSGDVSLFAKWTINTYSLVASSEANGSITPSGTTTKNYGSSQSYQIEADEGYQIKDVLVDEVSVGVVDLYEFSDIQVGHTISVSFESIPISTVAVTAVSPASGYDTKSININSIVGTGFAPSASVKLTKTGETDITCTNIVFASSTTISNASCNIETASSGDWNVVVTNSDTGSGQLAGGFVVREYAVRDVGPLGGYIFYVNPDYVSDGWKYLEAATSSRSSTAKWADATTTLMNAFDTAVGTGLANTELVTGSDSSITSAIEYVLNYSVNGVDNWFLPSKDELNLMYTELHQYGLGGFASTSHWSSSEIDATTAWRQTFNGGAQSSGSKNNSYAIRAIRRFTTCPTYSISYNGNGNTTGTIPVDNISYLAGTSVTVLDQNTLAREGYTFIGWNTASDGSGTNYATSSALTMPVNGITLYAKWYRPNFTIAILPDTQSYVNWKKAEMTDQLDWLVNNKSNLNLKFVSHVGDIVQNWDGVPSDWEFVQSEMTKLKTAGIPYSLLPGNHDYAYMSRDSSVFNTYFPLSNYSDMTSYGGSYDIKSDNQYHILSVDKDNNGSPDDKVLILSLEFGPREAVVNWAKGVLMANSSTTAIITTHAYLQPNGDLLEYGDNHAASNGYGLGDDVYDGDELWEELIYPYNNVQFVFSGHDGESADGSALRFSNHADGSPIYQVMANYQYYPVNEAGYLVLLNFTENQVIMKTFSPWTNTYKIDSGSQATWNWTPFDFE